MLSCFISIVIAVHVVYDDAVDLRPRRHNVAGGIETRPGKPVIIICMECGHASVFADVMKSKSISVVDTEKRVKSVIKFYVITESVSLCLCML